MLEVAVPSVGHEAVGAGEEENGGEGGRHGGMLWLRVCGMGAIDKREDFWEEMG